MVFNIISKTVFREQHNFNLKTGMFEVQNMPVEIKVLENTSKAELLLPITEGFLFGNYEYDEYYLEDLWYTKGELEKLLKEWKEGDLVEYYAWW